MFFGERITNTIAKLLKIYNVQKKKNRKKKIKQKNNNKKIIINIKKKWKKKYVRIDQWKIYMHIKKNKKKNMYILHK